MMISSVFNSSYNLSAKVLALSQVAKRAIYSLFYKPNHSFVRSSAKLYESQQPKQKKNS